jgi:hypothetical protein
MEKPCTVAEIAALPEGGGFGIEERVIDGVLRRVPVAPDLAAIYHDEHDVIGYVDGDGVRWRLGQYRNGQWFRRRE